MRNAGSVSASNSTTSALDRRCAPRTVIRSAAPGPAPMKITRPMDLATEMWPASIADQQRTAGAVRGRVDDDQCAGDAIRCVRGERERLLGLDDDAADLVDGERIG